jgi:hypothetical protein
LSLSEANHSEDVKFVGGGEIEVDETKQVYTMNCTETETFNRTTWRGNNETVTRCVDLEKIVLSEKVVATKSVEVSAELTGYQKYDPTIDIKYDAEKRDDRPDLYYLNI